MMSNSKVLTVSYGTFSCTLEGFEDSFDTMKVIAEYFRDLAADDRYFGAEPPQPDADMLARIAEKEIARRVEAHEDQGRIVLSAEPALPASVEHTGTEDTVEENVADAPPDTTPVEIEADVPRDLVSTDANDAAAYVDMDVTAQDARERDAGEADMAEDIVLPENAEADQIASEGLTEDAAEIAQSAIDEIAVAATESIEEAAPALVEAPAGAEDGPGSRQMTADTTATAALAANVSGEAIADKLERIRAIVSRKTAPDAAYTEDEHADDFATLAHAGDELVAGEAQIDESFFAATDTGAQDVYEDRSDVHDMPEPSTAAETGAAELAADEVVETPAADDLIGALDLAEFAADAQEPQTEDDAELDTAELAIAGDPDDVDDLSARLAAYAHADDEVETAEDADQDVAYDAAAFDSDDDIGAILACLSNEEDAAEKAPGADVQSAPEKVAEAFVERAPRAARVLKVKRSDLEAAISAGALDEVDDAQGVNGTSLSAEDEADLMANLAEVEADMPQPEPEVDRLMAKADAQMGEPESAKNRDAFAHLRAAVAAKKTDDKIGGDAAAAKEEGLYKTDLAAVVKPRRPEANGTPRAARPQAKPAPLKLVAEQRVDTPKDGPVQPRRIAANEDDGGDATFVDYADTMGAQNLPQLLEAAASYLAFVENRETFSRPQIMNKVKLVEGGDFSREDGLRSFGQLLRAGKIEKLKGGRFAATNEIGFRPGAREAS